MPLYEYICMDCEHKFDKLRAFSQADDPAECPHCHAVRAKRTISLFAAPIHSDGGGESHSHGGGCSCGGCSSHNCGNCGH